MKKFFLSVGAILCNESMIVSEWMQHYLEEGVEHFYLIENHSSEEYSSSTLLREEYGDHITYVRNDTRHAQTRHYNTYFQKAIEDSEWLLIVDLDEFVYARHPFATIAEYIQHLEIETERVDQIMIPWKMYGSSGFEQQPENVVHHFLKRQLYDGKTKSQAMRNHNDINVKSIVRTSSVVSFQIHGHRMKPGSVSRRSNNQVCPSDNWLLTTEDILKSESLHLNHYAIQSLEFFTKIKMTRGSASTACHDNVRNVSYFHRYDSSPLVDNELSMKKKSNRTSRVVDATAVDG